jgi:hypothetical protein
MPVRTLLHSLFMFTRFCFDLFAFDLFWLGFSLFLCVCDSVYAWIPANFMCYSMKRLSCLFVLLKF